MSRNQDPGKRSLILRSALQVFGAKGYSATTIRDIAESSGIAAGTVYLYFDDKEDLFRCSFEESWAEFHAGMQHILAQDQDIEFSMTRLIDYGFGLLSDLYPLVRGMYTQANLKDMISPHLDRLSLVLADFFGRRSSLQLFGIADPQLQRFYLKLMIAGILSTVSQSPPEEFDEVVRELKHNLVYGLKHGMRRAAGNQQ